jgi:DNA topoisomerase-1
MVNLYLREITGADITAKDFRTWHGTVHAAEHLHACGPSTSEKDVKHNLVLAIKAVAEQLGNRPATCRKYYVHPMVLDLYSRGTLTELMSVRVTGGDPNGLGFIEKNVLQILTREVRPTERAS